MVIKNVKIVPAISDKGLIAFASVTLDDDVLLSSIAVYRKLNGGLRLLYPSKRIKDGDMTIFHPLNHKASRLIEDAIFKECKKVFRESSENDRYCSIGLRH